MGVILTEVWKGIGLIRGGNAVLTEKPPAGFRDRALPKAGALTVPYQVAILRRLAEREKYPKETSACLTTKPHGTIDLSFLL